MIRVIAAGAFAAAFAVTAAAQDTTVKSKTTIDADDAKVVTMKGCLQRGTGDLFVISNATVAKGDDLEAKSRTEVDVDDDETEVKTKSRTEVETDDDDEAVGTSGVAKTYEVTAKDGVNLAAHVGHTVEITAVALEAKDGDDDAEVEMETKTKVEVDDAPDSKVKSKTEAELPRGSMPRLTVMTVKHVAPSCSM